MILKTTKNEWSVGELVTLDWTRTHLIKEGKMSYSYMIDSSYFPMWDYHFSGDL